MGDVVEPLLETSRDSPGLGSTAGASPMVHLTQEMQDAMGGRVPFTAGEEFSDRAAATASSEEALKGSSLYEPFVSRGGAAVF